MLAKRCVIEQRTFDFMLKYILRDEAKILQICFFLNPKLILSMRTAYESVYSQLIMIIVIKPVTSCERDISLYLSVIYLVGDIRCI